MEPRIEHINKKKLIGMSIEMSLADNRTYQLFSTFMPRRREILLTMSNDVFDVRVYTNEYYLNFSPTNVFVKWAAVEVDNDDKIPTGMASLEIPAGDYAVFTHQGVGSGQETFQYIFMEWLPKNKNYRLDSRPHFDILGEKYQRREVGAVQEIWIPIQAK